MKVKSDLKKTVLLFSFVFLVSIAIAWNSYDNYVNQATQNHLFLVNRAEESAKKFKERLHKWIGKSSQTPRPTVYLSLQNGDVASGSNDPLWPVSTLWPIDQLNEYTKNIQENPEFLEKIIKTENSLDPFLIRLWLSNQEDGEKQLKKLERAFERINLGLISEQSKLYFESWTWVAPLNEKFGSGYRSLNIPVELRPKNDWCWTWKPGTSLGALANDQIAGASFSYVLNQAGEEFIHKKGNWHQLVLSICFIFSIFVYGIYFFYKSQMSLIEQSRQSEQLVADISHELRTPVTSLRMYAEMLLDGNDNDSSKRTEYYQRMVSEATRLGRLIDNVLDFSRLSKGKYEPNIQKTSINSLLDVIKEVVLSLDHQNYVSISKAPEGDVFIDQVASEQVVYNLVNNALKYAPSSMVEISFRLTAEFLETKIRDEGPGIEESVRNNIFDAFVRGKKSHDSQIKGSGLGLSISKELMESMNGQLILEKSSKGATFICKFPLCEKGEF